MALDCNPGEEIVVTDLVQEINSKENSLGLGTAGQVLATNSAADGKEWITTNSAEWGNITGTLSNQTDLQTELDAKVNHGVISSTNEPTDIVTCTQAEYDGITPDVNTLYFII